MNSPAKCGDKFGDLTVLKRFIGRYNGSYCKCKCTCGRECFVGEHNLKMGKSKRCKHCSKLLCKQRLCKLRLKTYKHGLSSHEIYPSWNNIIQCCYNPKSYSFHLYGGRGIKVCDEWLNVTGFYNDMGERPAGSNLRRIDTDGDFEPGNCIWVSKKK